MDHRALTIMAYKATQKAHSPAGSLTIVRSPRTQFQASLFRPYGLRSVNVVPNLGAVSENLHGPETFAFVTV